MRKFLCSLVILLLPLTTAHAANLSDELDTLAAKVAYVERVLGFVERASLSHDEIYDIITRGTAWLTNAQEENGHFRYEYLPYDDTYVDDDNSVRQAGALFQLSEILRHDIDATLTLRPTIERAIQYLESISVEDTYDAHTFRCVHAVGREDQCKLGATSLALIGILSYVEVYPEARNEYEDLIGDYLSYLKASRIEGKGFRNKHNVVSELQSYKESSFSNGEVLLALVRYYQYNEDEEVKQLAQDLYQYLRSTEFDTPLYLWIMAALRDMQTLWPNPDYAVYAKEYTTWRVDGVSMRKGTKHNYCAYAEGVVSAYSVLEETLPASDREALRAEIDFWNQKNARLQITDRDQLRYTLVDDSLTLLELPHMEYAHGGFLTGENELSLRIDFTQHCLSAYLQTLTDIDKVSLEDAAI